MIYLKLVIIKIKMKLKQKIKEIKEIKEINSFHDVEVVEPCLTKDKCEVIMSRRSESEFISYHQPCSALNKMKEQQLVRRH